MDMQEYSGVMILIVGWCCMKIAGELAAAKSSGPGTLQLHFYDALYNMTEQDVADHIKLVR